MDLHNFIDIIISKYKEINMDIVELKNEIKDKFKKSDALTELKNLSNNISKEEFLKFSNSALLDAYRSNRVKAVEYMLSFYEKEQPILLAKIHLDVMLSDQKDFESGKKMLIPLVKHFSDELCSNLINQMLEYKGKQNPRMDIAPYKLRAEEILKIIAEKELPPDAPKEINPTLLEVLRTNPSNLKNDARAKFSKSDNLTELKELASTMSKEEFLDFADSAMKSAYDSNRVKAVTYFLSFYEKDQPSLIIKVHLQRMLANQRDFDLGKKMLIPLVKHYSYELCDQIMQNHIKITPFDKSASEARQKEISKIILENTLSTENKSLPKKLKI